MVAELDGSVLTVVPTTVGQVVPEAAADREWAWVVEGLQAVQEEAAPLGVRLAIEPLNRFETYLVNRADQALALADDVGGPCGVCLDTFHLAIEEADLVAAVERVGPRLVDFHVADNNRLAPGWARCPGGRSSRRCGASATTGLSRRSSCRPSTAPPRRRQRAGRGPQRRPGRGGGGLPPPPRQWAGERGLLHLAVPADRADAAPAARGRPGPLRRAARAAPGTIERPSPSRRSAR